MDLGIAPESARHTESSGTDAGRQRVIAGNARIQRSRNFAASGRGNSSADATVWLIRVGNRLSPRLVVSEARSKAFVMAAAAAWPSNAHLRNHPAPTRTAERVAAMPSRCLFMRCIHPEPERPL